MADIRRENIFLFSGFQWWRNTVPELIHRGRLSIIFLHLIFFLTFLHHIFAIEVLFDLQKWYLKKVFNFRDKINWSVSCLRVELEQIFFIRATVTAFKMLASFSRCLLIRQYVILTSWSVILSFLSYSMIYHYSKRNNLKKKPPAKSLKSFAWRTERLFLTKEEKQIREHSFQYFHVPTRLRLRAASLLISLLHKRNQNNHKITFSYNAFMCVRRNKHLHIFSGSANLLRKPYKMFWFWLSMARFMFHFWQTTKTIMQTFIKSRDRFTRWQTPCLRESLVGGKFRRLPSVISFKFLERVSKTPITKPTKTLKSRVYFRKNHYL